MAIELRDLRYFVAVAQSLHFRHAAQQLHITQPALSRQIRALEVRINVQLFHRTKRSVQLTVAGQTFLAEAQQVLQQAEQAVLTTQQVARGEIGQLKLSFTPSALRSIVPTAVRIFRARYPHVQLSMKEQCTQDQVEAFRQNQIDIGFLYPPIDEKLLITMPLRTEPLVIALPNNHPLAMQDWLKLDDLAAEPFILHPRKEGPHLYDQIFECCKQAGFQPNVAQEAVASQTRLGLVAAGMGVTFVPETLKDIVNPALTYRNWPEPALSLQLSMVRRRGIVPPTVHQFFDIVEELSRESKMFAMWM